MRPPSAARASLDAIRRLCDDLRHVRLQCVNRPGIPLPATPAPPLIALFLALWLACLPLPAGAAGEALFEAEVEVADTSAAVRSEGIVAAFAGVLTKVTGRTDPQAFAAWPRLRQAADSLLVEYRYRSEVAAAGSDPLASRRTLLTVRFDRQGVEALMRAEQLPVWGDTRPATLLLVAVEQGANRYIYTPDALPAAAAAITAASDRRGIPLLEPLMDLEDRTTLTFTEVWAGFPETIERIRARYGPDAVLVARLFNEAAAAWRAQWTLYHGRDREAWTSRGPLATTLEAGLSELADRLARRYVPDTGSGEQRLRLAVVGIASPADYARTLDFLAGLSAVSDLRPVLAGRDSLELELVTDVAPESLLRTIALGGMLVPVIDPGQPLGALPLFRLRP